MVHQVVVTLVSYALKLKRSEVGLVTLLLIVEETRIFDNWMIKLIFRSDRLKVIGVLNTHHSKIVL